jgi:hypothetical protein
MKMGEMTGFMMKESQTALSRAANARIRMKAQGGWKRSTT